MSEKQCKGCRIYKDIEQFPTYESRHKNGIRYHRNLCIPCWRKKLKALPSGQKYRTDRLRAKIVGLSIHDFRCKFKELMLLQNGQCAICGTEDACRPANHGTKDLLMDHCHETGVVRGLLCWNCNIAIGKLLDNPESCRRAALYLEQHGSVAPMVERFPCKEDVLGSNPS